MSVSLKNVSFAYGDTLVLQDVTWHLPDSGVVCLWGASGCGKTTALRLLAGLEKPDSGAVCGAGRVSMVFQEDRLLPWRTALENVLLTGADVEKAQELLAELGLTVEEAQAYPQHLSGGQQRRVALARALAAESDILLLDEPTAALDLPCKEEIARYLRQYKRAGGLLLLTTHDVMELDLCDRWYILKDGVLEPYNYDGDVRRLLERL